VNSNVNGSLTADKLPLPEQSGACRTSIVP
jgi:hypothetical protein